MEELGSGGVEAQGTSNNILPKISGEVEKWRSWEVEELRLRAQATRYFQTTAKTSTNRAYNNKNTISVAVIPDRLEYRVVPLHCYVKRDFA